MVIAMQSPIRIMLSLAIPLRVMETVVMSMQGPRFLESAIDSHG